MKLVTYDQETIKRVKAILNLYGDSHSYRGGEHWNVFEDQGEQARLAQCLLNGMTMEELEADRLEAQDKVLVDRALLIEAKSCLRIAASWIEQADGAGIASHYKGISAKLEAALKGGG